MIICITFTQQFQASLQEESRDITFKTSTNKNGTVGETRCNWAAKEKEEKDDCDRRHIILALAFCCSCRNPYLPCHYHGHGKFFI